MEHWQFLIQRQGDRSWHPLESLNGEILEGRYRVLARSNRPNANVEVRVTHSSTQEVPPKRRIQKRSRRTNSEGLMAVLPFTYFHPGIWELQCSGDVMSDILGKSWQYNIYLQVLSEDENRVVAELGDGESTESNLLDPLDTTAAVELVMPAEYGMTTQNATNNYLQVLSQDEKVVEGLGDGESTESNLLDPLDTTAAVELVMPAEYGMTTQNATNNYLQVLSQDEKVVEGLGDEESTESNLLDPLDTTAAVELVMPAEYGMTAQNAPNNYLQVLSDDEKVVGGLGDGESTESNLLDPLDTSAAVALVMPAHHSIITQNATNNTVLPQNTAEDIVIDQPVSPVWLKGETAEQILQNLIDLALSGSEALSEDETLDDATTSPVAPLLLLTLDQQTYVARWGEALTINGQVDLKEKVNPEAEIPCPENFYALELRIELRSPLRSEILMQRRQPLVDEVLPLSIKSVIDIPAECESKLILADISLYGAISDFGDVMLLASQSFTITADVTELLALRAAAQPSTPSLLDEENASLTPAPTAREAERSVSLDLALFNLVKSNKKDQPLAFQPSVNKSLPPVVNLRSPKKSTATRELQLPNFPPIAVADRVLEEEGAGGVLLKFTETPNPEDIVDQHHVIAPINLEELVIKNRPLLISNGSFPYLKQLKAASSKEEEVKDHIPDGLEIQATGNSEAVDITIDTDKHTPELASGDAQTQDEQITEVGASDQPITEVGASPSPELIDEDRDSGRNASNLNSELIIEGNPYSSPVIRKWLQSQGYILPEPTHVPKPSDNSPLPPRQTISKNQLPLPAPPPPPTQKLNLPLVDVKTAIAANGEVVKSEDIEIRENTEVVKSEDIEIPDNTEVVKSAVASLPPTELKAENQVPAVTPSLRRQIPPLPPPRRPKQPPAWLSQEIVVDDTYIEPESNTFEPEEQPESDISFSQTTTAVSNEPLPIPQLHIPDGELIAGKYVKIRVELPELPPQVVVKLWVEDYQTRWLLDGPHLLKNLQPNPLGGSEVMTQLNVPFGCLEIRVEAIALDLVTQQESHKVTIVRAVIPPNLPNLTLDQLFGI